MNEDELTRSLPAILPSRTVVPFRTLAMPSIMLPGMSDRAAEKLAGALIYVASDIPRVGRDTLAALLITLLENRGFRRC